MVRTVGFPLNCKENEHRQAMIFNDIAKMDHRDKLYFEEGYGESFAISDEMLQNVGVHVVSREEVLKQEIICDPKAGDADYIDQLHDGQIVFGWIHAVQNRKLTDTFLSKRLTGIAWEDMNEEGRHVFWRNNEIAGEAAIMHAFSCYGKMPYDTKVAVLGRGNVGRGAYKILIGLGAQVTVYDRRTEDLFRKEAGDYDVLVNAITWDVSRTDHIIYKNDLKKMKQDSMIIDVSCDEGMGIETSRPTTIEQPVYFVDGVLHYVVDHTPSIFYKTASKSISTQIRKYLPVIMAGQEAKDNILRPAIILDNGDIYDHKILKYQERGNELKV
ncbi:N(5)-(carboxyethyl)ornithine synthase [Virgibacillus profundi]|uniref:N(5)-(Carboxyethyl)ornithine synthase n=1 Tax=Virgibacillus profundi TaxID=2024555 RepID=A0A2A2IDB4_9BACI|nr:N(5)-(carboxyethyl)ornithine synthase [Virgibacillus profundi]PAV29368.1 N(5)-(carboxyethyl)ornithine synthase [Virgibacillus profundi]PXY53538.1 N(5)-(carboxyethyl)ornithine synthase [Virgibacillus profundi]